MKSSCILFLLLAISSPSFSQESIILKGKITADSIDAPIHIINITAEKGTVTEASGEFQIEVKQNDLLLFSSVQFQKKEVLVTSEVLSSGFLAIELQKELTELDEVRVHKFSGNLANDIEDIKTFDPRIIGFALSDKKPLSVEERKLFAITRPDDPVGTLYGIISGQKKMYEKAIENNRITALVYKARDFVPDEYFIETLLLPENKIMDFLYYCSLKSNFQELVNRNERLVLMEFLEEMITKYNEFVEE